MDFGHLICEHCGEGADLCRGGVEYCLAGGGVFTLCLERVDAGLELWEGGGGKEGEVVLLGIECAEHVDLRDEYGIDAEGGVEGFCICFGGTEVGICCDLGTECGECGGVRSEGVGE